MAVEHILTKIQEINNDTPDFISFEGIKWRSGIGAIGFSFEAQKREGKWELKKCGMSWIS